MKEKIIEIPPLNFILPEDPAQMKDLYQVISHVPEIIRFYLSEFIFRYSKILSFF